MSKFTSTIITIAITAVVVVFALGLFSLIAGIPLYFLWNWLMPDLFGVKIITFWQAVGIVFLCNTLFKSASSTSEKK